MPAIQGDGFVSCPKCHAMFSYHGRKPDPGEVEDNCNVHGRDDFTLDERINYAVYNGWDAFREYFDEDGARPSR